MKKLNNIDLDIKKEIEKKEKEIKDMIQKLNFFEKRINNLEEENKKKR